MSGAAARVQEANDPPVALFRAEAIDARKDRLYGNVAIATPIGWRTSTLFLLVLTLALGGFAASATHTKTATVDGELVPMSGYAIVTSPRPGIAVSVLIEEGNVVRAGQPLIEVTTDHLLSTGNPAGAQLARSTREQRAQVEIESERNAEAGQALVEQKNAEISGIERELIYLERQIELQTQLLGRAKSDLARVEEIGKRGFISGRDLQAKADLLITRQQQMAVLEQARSSKRASLSASRNQQRQVQDSNQAAAARSRVTKAELDQRLTSLQSANSYLIAAPIQGTVTDLNVRPGDHLIAERSVMKIVPDTTSLYAEVRIPDSSAAFVKEGQRVTIEIEAFPQERYGTASGTIERLSSVSSEIEGAAPEAGRIYIGRIRIDPRDIRRFRSIGAVRPGMTISAHIVTGQESILNRLLGR